MSNFNKEKNNEELLIAKTMDQYDFCISKNKITYTDFMQINEKSLINKYLIQNHINNYIWFGGINDADREILIFYPTKLTKEMALSNIDTILSCVHIELPSEIQMEHREFLSGIMKLGIVREKFGDIIIRETGADIIAFCDTADYFLNNLPLLTRFQKSTITKIPITNLEQKQVTFIDINIIVSSIRLDNIVAELCHCSRSHAQNILKEQRVFVDGVLELKDSKKINIGSIITIRGKGKFIFDSTCGNTKSGREKLLFKKYN